MVSRTLIRYFGTRFLSAVASVFRLPTTAGPAGPGGGPASPGQFSSARRGRAQHLQQPA